MFEYNSPPCDIYIMENKQDELRILYARLDDLCRKADRGEATISDFLSPRELYFAESFLRGKCAFFCFGGYADAERRRIYILPEYMEGICDIAELADFGVDSKISVLYINGSGYEKLNHRSFMGAVLGLGLERAVIGDIVQSGENEAYVFCDSAIAAYILENLNEVGRDKVKVTPCQSFPESDIAKRFISISDTVASPRLDCVVASLCSLSREKARVAVESATVELDYECVEKPDREVVPPAVISVRGYGKFKILSLADKTRKGRYRLSAQKYL